ncbi:MAG: hypothetical protein CMM37_05135 [Rhodospirillaceae bacterium]|jgi:nucleoside-diphosphate-sugar epimerase|nr:hypothetical protein [Rhodospirillaceae bacterium]
MTVLITGAGLIATHSAAALAAKNENILFYDVAPNARYIDLVMEGKPYSIEVGDILDLPNIMRVIGKYNITGIVHTAAFLPEKARTNPSLAARVNIIGSVNIFEAHRLAKLKKMVFSSTIGVFDSSVRDGKPWTENHRWGPNSYYGSTKLSAEMLGMIYARDYGVDLTAVRFSSVYGISQYYTSRASAFMRDVVEPAALYGKSTIRQPVTDINQYLYASDAGEAVALAFKKKTNPSQRIFNISDGKLTGVKEVIKIVESQIPGASIKLTKSAWEKSKGTSFVPEPFNLNAARKYLGYKPKWPMVKAVKDYARLVRLRGE